MKIQPVIMSGGAGTRLWPMSRAVRPKQFLALGGGPTLFEETVRRLSGEGFLPPLVIGGAGHEGLIAEQLAAAGVAPADIVLEPAPRNTAAVAAVAAEWTRANAKGALALLAPADHRVGAPDDFRALVARAAQAAAEGRIVTFGVKPDSPHTGYGYIERGAPLADGVFAVKAFREKPDEATAQGYLDGGRHFWNAGVFLFDPQAMLDELGAHAPAVREGALAALAAARRQGAALALDRAAFEDCPSTSIDYAVMEKTAKAAVAGPADIGWSDVGAWTALADADESRADLCLVDARNCVVETDGAFVGVIGLDDIVVVVSGDAVLVAPKDRAQDVREIVKTLKDRGRTDLL